MRVVFALVISLIFVFQCVAQSNLPLSKIESQPSTLRHANTQLNVLTVDLGTIISKPLIQRGLEFEQQTGIKVNVTKVPFGQLYNEISKDLSSPTSQYDIIAYASQTKLRSLVTQQHRLSLYEGGQIGELYDLQADPLEQHNLWNEPDAQTLKTTLLCQLIDTMMAHSETSPLPLAIA